MKKELVKTLIITAIIFTITFLLFVPSYDENRYRNDKIVDNTVTAFLEAIQERDSGGIKQLFSQGVRDEIGDEKLEEGIRYLFSIFEGEVISYEIKPYGLGKEGEGWGKKRIIADYKFILETTEDSYRIYIVYYTKDTITPDFKGLYQIRMEKESDISNDLLSRRFMGIYVPSGFS